MMRVALALVSCAVSAWTVSESQSARDAEAGTDDRPRVLADLPESAPPSLRHAILDSLPLGDCERLREARNDYFAAHSNDAVLIRRLEALREQRVELAARYAPGTDRGPASQLQFGAQPGWPADLLPSVQKDPYREGFRQMLGQLLDDNLRGLARELTDEERAQFIRDFTEFDFEKDWVLFRAAAEGRPVPVGAAAAAGRIAGLLMAPYLFEKGADKVWDELTGKADSEELEKKRLIWIQREVQEMRRENDDRLDQIGAGVDVANEQLEQLQRGTRAVIWGQNEHQKALIELAERVQEEAQNSFVAHKRILEKVETNGKAIAESTGQLHGDNLRQEAILQQNRSLLVSNVVSLEYIKGATYDTLSTNQKLRWVEDRVIQFGSEDDRQAEATRLRRLSVSEDVGRYMEVGQAAFMALGKLGVDPEVVQTGQKAISTASTINKTIQAALKGDYLGAAGALLSGLFGGGPDADELRHQETMKKLDEIQKKQEEILAGIHDLQRQVAMLTELTMRQHEDVMEKLEAIHGDVVLTRDILAWQIGEPLRVLRETLDEAKRSPDPASYFARPNHQMTLNKGWGDLAAVAPLPKAAGRFLGSGPGPVLWLDAEPRPGQAGPAPYLERVVKPALTYFDGLPDERKLPVLQALFMPCFDDTQLLTVLADEGPGEPPVQWFSPVGNGDDGLVLRDFQLFLNPVAVAEYAEIVHDLAPILLRLDHRDGHWEAPNGDLANLAGKLDGQRSDVALLLRKSLYLLNLSIAQQNLLAGHTLLPDIDRDAEDPAIAAWLEANEILRQNRARYLVHRSGVADSSYRTFLAFRDPYYLEQAIRPGGRSFTIRRLDMPIDPGDGVKAAWTIESAGGFRSILPDARSKALGVYEHSPHLPRLLTLRGELANQLADLELELSREESDLLWLLIAD